MTKGILTEKGNSQLEQIEFRLIRVGTDEYQMEMELRDSVLRKPLGLKLEEGLPDENRDYHLGCFHNGWLVGVLVLTPLGGNEIKMRQVAVTEAYRGAGLGTRLVRYSEEFVCRVGYEKIVLNARKTAVTFYQRLGYQKVGGEFIEVTIPHYRMEKALKSASD